jgi:hypothetical protein
MCLLMTALFYITLLWCQGKLPYVMPLAFQIRDLKSSNPDDVARDARKKTTHLVRGKTR